MSRSVLITGGTTGLGYHTALILAREHPEWKIVIAARSDKNGAAESINKAVGRPDAVVFRPLDLSDLASVREFAKAWSHPPDHPEFPPLQALSLNAALQFPDPPMIKNKAGIEMTFAVAHVGHALLFHLLVPRHVAQGAENDPIRIVATASGVHDPAQKSGLPDAKYTSAQDLAYPPPDMARQSGRQHYSNAKLSNVLWTYALAKRLENLKKKDKPQQNFITVTAYDPGLMPGTGLAREAGPVLRFIWHHLLPYVMKPLSLLLGFSIQSPAASGAELARMLAGADAAGISGKYYSNRNEIPSSIDSYDEAKQEDLWNWTVHYVAAGDEEEERRFQALE